MVGRGERWAPCLLRSQGTRNKYDWTNKLIGNPARPCQASRSPFRCSLPGWLLVNSRRAQAGTQRGEQIESHTGAHLAVHVDLGNHKAPHSRQHLQLHSAATSWLSSLKTLSAKKQRQQMLHGTVFMSRIHLRVCRLWLCFSSICMHPFVHPAILHCGSQNSCRFDPLDLDN